MRKLKPEIIEYLRSRAGLASQTIKNEVSSLAKKYPSLPPNSRAQIYALSKGQNILRFLNEGEKSALPNIETAKEKISIRPTASKRRIETLIEYATEDSFIQGHIDELNKAYNYGCYTACFILARKIVENLLIDILRIKYPESKLGNRELYFDITQGRFKDFSIILKSLYDKRTDFGTNRGAIERLYTLAKKLKDDANDKAHSWFHLVKRKGEIDELELPAIIDLVKIVAQSI